jgi:hypothetical protein
MGFKQELKGCRGDLRLAHSLKRRCPRSRNAKRGTCSVVGHARRQMRRKVRLALRFGSEPPAFVSIDQAM